MIEEVPEISIIVDESELNGRFKDNLVIKVEKNGWVIARRNSEGIWGDSTHMTEEDKDGAVCHVFSQFKAPGYSEGFAEYIKRKAKEFNLESEEN